MGIRLEKTRIPQHLLKYFETDLCSSCYICHTIEILREIRRVLRKDGVVFWNIGDSYSATRWSNTPSTSFNPAYADVLLEKHTNLPPKNLCLIPFRVAISAQTDGWWVRSVIIWNKPNPMPESVKDRPTESHEYILMLTKLARYYYDQEAVREPPKPQYAGQSISLAPERDDSLRHDGGRSFQLDGLVGRNLRSVWTFPTQGYPEAHFATFPEELPERCIKAATPEYGCCDKCGMPYERIIRSSNQSRTRQTGIGQDTADGTKGRAGELETQTLGWQQTCKCKDSKPMPSVVLDPFAGSGTTLWVAKHLNRKAVGYELSSNYCELIVERNKQQGLL